MENKKYVDKILSVFFDKTKRRIALLFVFGFILRLITARNFGLSPDDAGHATRPIGVFSSGKISFWSQSTPLWYYIQGIFYKIIGATQIGSRFASVLFGSLLIILVFLFVKKVLKSERIAFISSFLITISPFLIKMSLPEMDVATGFFMLFSAYFLFEYFESNSNKHFMMSAFLMGISTMIKFYALMFAFSFMLFFIYKESKLKKGNKKIIKKVLLFGVILLVFSCPTFIHNYLLYKDKGILDFIFTNTFGLGREKSAQYYSWAATWNEKTDYKGFFFGNQKNLGSTKTPGILIILWVLLKSDPILFLFGFLGLLLIFKKNRDYFWFFILVFVPAFVYLGSQIPMVKHLTWIFMIASPLAGSMVNNLSKKFSNIKLEYIFLIFLIFSFIYLGMNDAGVRGHIYGESAAGKLMDFKEESIPENSLVIVDARIFRGTMHWIFNGRNYVETAYFFEYMDELEDMGEKGNVEVYFIECVIDDCGWGTIKDKPDINKSMEDLTLWFANGSIYSQGFDGPNENKFYLPFIGEKVEYYRVYKANLMLNPIILEVVKQTHTWFLYPIGYDRRISPIFDDFSTYNIFDALLKKFAMGIIYLELICSFLMVFYLIYLFVYKVK